MISRDLDISKQQMKITCRHFSSESICYILQRKYMTVSVSDCVVGDHGPC
jgi:hypothetical protein